MSIADDQEKIKQAAYAEARRYMNNAEAVLEKTARDGKFYADAKYVRMASGTAYLAVLLAFDAYLQLKGVALPKKKRLSIDFYQNYLGKLNGKLLDLLNNAYDTLHLAGYYDGNKSAKVIRDGFDTAYEIIETIKPPTELPPDALKSSWREKLRLLLV
ncbi:MAG: DUF5618 family protein [Planctomycetota bacterium]|jgi:hypothetical protein|nr:DUF5618 family protein [Planctomycetota bacterium]